MNARGKKTLAAEFALATIGISLLGMAASAIKEHHMVEDADARTRAMSQNGVDWQATLSHTNLTEVSVGECILLFGAFCNGNMGDVVQFIAMTHLLASVAPNQCFWYSHPSGEGCTWWHNGFFDRDKSRLIHVTADQAWKVNRFKAFVIGGGGIFSAASRAPLFDDEFVETLTVPIVVLGAGATKYGAQSYSKLLTKAVFVSGGDGLSVNALAAVLGRVDNPTAKPEDVPIVRDLVLSDKMLSDTDGACWKQSEGDRGQPLCFVLPVAITSASSEMHRQLVSKVVRSGDRFINVFPKHHEEIEQFRYPGTVEEIVDPMEYVKQLCSCKAIISTRLHGAILGLHMGVPTFGAFHLNSGNKVPDTMRYTMNLPDQFLRIDEHLDRKVVDRAVAHVRQLYEDGDRRAFIHFRLSHFYHDCVAHAHHVLYSVIGVEQQEEYEATPQLLTQTLEGPRTSGMAARDFTAGVVMKPAAAVSAAAVDWTEKTLPSSAPLETNRTTIGHDCVVALFLLFAILGLATLPSKDDCDSGGAGVSLVGHPPTAASTPVGKVATCRPRDQTEVDGCRSIAKIASFSSLSDSELWPLEVRSTVTSALPAPPGQDSGSTTFALASGGKRRPSKMLFILNFTMWIALATTFNIYSKSYLLDSSDPVGLLTLQGAIGVLVLCSIRRLGVGPVDDGTVGSSVGLLDLLMQPAVGLLSILYTGQALLTNLSLLAIGVALTNALKAAEPVAATVFSYFILGKSVHRAKVAALAAIIAGIYLLTSESNHGGSRHEAAGEGGDTGEGAPQIPDLSSVTFNLGVVCCSALRNVLIKRGKPLPPHQILLVCSVAVAAVGAVLMMLRIMFRSTDILPLGVDYLSETVDEERSSGGGAVFGRQSGFIFSMDGVIAGLSFLGYNLASLNLLASISAVAHAVCNSVKSVVIVGSGIVLVGEVMTGRQLGGTAVAILGVILYSSHDRRTKTMLE